jgi:hypothetical protein
LVMGSNVSAVVRRVAECTAALDASAELAASDSLVPVHKV